MIAKGKELILGKIYYLLWLIIYFIYRFQLEIRETVSYHSRLIVRRLWLCWPTSSVYADIATLAVITNQLSKLPKHIAISVTENEPKPLLSQLWNWRKSKVRAKSEKEYEEESNDEIDLQALAKVISWAWASHIPVISLYDYHGRLKTRYRELGCYVQEEINQNFWAMKKYSDASEPPSVKFHNVPKINGYSNGVNGIKSSTPLHLVVFSNEDGKSAIIRTATDLSLQGLQSHKSPVESAPDVSESDSDLRSLKAEPKEIDEYLLESSLNRVHSWISNTGAKTEPDLLVIMGSIQSTLGFLPWHIRLTEIHWLPTIENVEMRDFMGVLQKYSHCQKRFGT